MKHSKNLHSNVASTSKRNFLRLGALSVGALAIGVPLVGCGGGSSSDSAPQTANVVGVPVEGLAYTSKSASGMTSQSGEFSYAPGESITFTVGNVVVGTLLAVPGDGKVTAQDLVGLNRTVWWNIESIVIDQFLQSLHKDIKTTSFIIPKPVKDGQGNVTYTFEGKLISIPQSAHDNLKNVPLTYLNDPSGRHVNQTELETLVRVATAGNRQLLDCVSAITNRIFYPAA